MKVRIAVFRGVVQVRLRGVMSCVSSYTGRVCVVCVVCSVV